MGGVLHAKGANIEGTINAPNGKIGQFTVKDGYMNLMVSGPKNLVMDADVVKYLTYHDTKSAKYYLDPNSNNGEIVLEDYGYIVPGRTYTVLIDLKLNTQRTEVSDNDVVKITVYNQQYTLSEMPIQTLNERHEIVATFELSSKYSDSPYISNMKTDSEINAPIILTSPITDEESLGTIEIYEVKIVEGDHRDDIYMDDAGLVTSDFAGDTMSWSITPDRCVWWNQDTSKLDPLMKLDRKGLYVKGEIEATSGNFVNCTIDETCTINGKVSAVTGKLGCLHIEDSGGVYYTLPNETEKTFYIHPTNGVNIVEATIGGWRLETNSIKNSYVANIDGSITTVNTRFTPENLIVEYNGTLHTCSWLSIINAINPSTASVEEIE